jgi:hypothetical protein
MSERKPTVKLVGGDGNVFAIIGACVKAARRAGWTSAQVQDLQHRMMHAESYDHVLRIALEELEVE